MKRLETERLILRHFEHKDARSMYQNWARDEEVTQHLTWQAHHSERMTEKVVADWVASYNNPDFFQWAIVEKSSGSLIGSISVVHSVQKEKTIGYVLGKKWWNQGYMTEALQKVIHYLFTETDTRVINSYHELENKASGRVMEKAGMIYQGLQARLVDGEIKQFPYYEVLKNRKHS